ncbi:replication initiation factor domain-containing protein [Pseudoxanthomonas beigongshangi]|uniref:replication initiation factor domain-containing protein n=1 Tax=Pseudoxanthomonas beigongshangi TaxID=2782537 RepID=UPI00193C7494|nr:replication initiation factor domain-containing protein [Pseudoxanthomonas beigongshangi]
MISLREGRPSDGMTFSPVGAVGSQIGPRSNTGQKSALPTHGALVDFLTVVFSQDRLAERGFTRISLLLPGIFGLRPSDVRAGELHAKRWQFYKASAVIVDSEGELVGRIGCEGNGDTVCVSLSGAACKFIRTRDEWRRVRMQIEACGGRISRCDVAYDDYDGLMGTVRELEAKARETLTESGGCLLFANGGTPPKTKFLDDHGGGSGCTLYVGQKGHKQLCVYEKGKQLGVTDSPWTRYEARLYGKHCEVPTDILTEPMKYLRGSYGYMELLLAKVCEGIACAIEYTKRAVEATGTAMQRWSKRQWGKSAWLLIQVFGVEGFARYASEVIAREGVPARFKKLGKASAIVNQLRAELCPS